MVAIGAGILWLGWNGFNGGDPYFAGADAATAVINTNLATAAALLMWVIWDMVGGPQRKPTFLGGVNGMVTGLVAITPAAGYVNGAGALLIGGIASSIVWVSWNKVGRLSLFKKVDDAMGVFHTHGVAGLTGGILVGFLADPSVVVYPGSGKTSSVAVTGLIYGHPLQVLWQVGAAGTVIIWDALLTFLILKLIGLFVPLRYPDEVLETGDVAAHDEEAYPSEAGVERRGFEPREPAPVPIGGAVPLGSGPTPATSSMDNAPGLGRASPSMGSGAATMDDAPGLGRGETS
jgi:Amt family ammonium transporter